MVSDVGVGVVSETVLHMRGRESRPLQTANKGSGMC